jgi:hypothetical protein
MQNAVVIVFFNLRCRIIALIPGSSEFVAFDSALGIAKFHLVQLAEVFLVGSCAAEITLGAVSVDSDVKASRSSLGIVFAVGLEGIDEGVGSVIGFLQLVGLNLCGLFKSLSGFKV